MVTCAYEFYRILQEQIILTQTFTEKNWLKSVLLVLITCGQEDRSGEFRMVLDVVTFVLLRYKDSGDLSKAQA